MNEEIGNPGMKLMGEQDVRKTAVAMYVKIKIYTYLYSICK